MSAGRKKQSDIEIKAPSRITQTEFNAPTGDRYSVSQVKNRQVFQSNLAPQTLDTVNQAMRGLQDLAGELGRPSPRRQTEIFRRARDFYDLQAEGIHREADDTLSRTRSDLSKRFGGTYNASFGTELLSRIEDDRNRQLANARREAALYGEDLIRSDEDSRIQRFTLFQNYLTDLNNQARGLESNGAQILMNERSRATDLAVRRANLALQNREREDRLRNSRAGLISNLVGSGAMLLTASNPVTAPFSGLIGDFTASGARSLLA